MPSKRQDTLSHSKQSRQETSHKFFRWQRILTQLFLLLFLPLLIPTHIIFILIFATNKEKTSSLIYKYLSYFFKVYFNFASIEPFNIFPIPKKPTKPTIFFTTRVSEIYTLYLASIFPYRVHLPYQHSLAKFPLHHFFPWLRLGHFITTLGYKDDHLEKTSKTLQKHLKKTSLSLFLSTKTTLTLKTCKNFIATAKFSH